MPLFEKKKTTEEIMKEQKKELRSGTRNMDRETYKLKLEEQKLQTQVKNALQKGDQATAKVLAKQIVQLRKQQERMTKMKGTMNTVQYKASSMHTQEKMMGAIKTTGTVMKKINEQMNPQEMQKTIMEFEKANEKMGMSEEMMDDALENLFEDDEEEVDEAMEQIYDEIGLDMSGKLSKAKTGTSSLKVKDKDLDEIEDDDELLRRVMNLK
ncbi:hypothetical protein FDP41_013637 [Naegleria fowleri]|uniref:Uncharacterized protein n=1 Tax=Naegleria fowleri TaxID=5763 RepID=A0A6A5BQT7_NAEFO|nr:uncharacterized protein FDP41_013637 [Naegleria fowleri]KAF0980423.1 hypothetical protein FDP41_013637 [Naegleria fowleri]CAG4710989.1 unnamed protein product [Naegleria fowleri]